MTGIVLNVEKTGGKYSPVRKKWLIPYHFVADIADSVTSKRYKFKKEDYPVLEQSWRNKRLLTVFAVNPDGFAEILPD